MRWMRRAILAGALALAASLPGCEFPASAPKEAAGLVPGWADTCAYVGDAQIDPILAYGQPTSSHMHSFFGTSVAPTSTASTLLESRTNCTLAQDHSGYWVPALYGRHGAEIRPTSLTAYFYEPEGDPSLVRPFPARFSMVAGDSGAAAPQSIQTVWWSCDVADVPKSPTPPDCTEEPGDYVVGHVRFPSCWNGGRSADRTDPDANESAFDGAGNVVYADDDGDCPADHPTPLPSLTLKIAYAALADGGRVDHLASGGLYSLHADFLSATPQGVARQLVARCTNQAIACQTLVSPRIETATSTGRAVTVTAACGRCLSDARRVTLAGRNVPFKQVSDTRLTVTVPGGAASGRLAVTTNGATPGGAQAGLALRGRTRVAASAAPQRAR